MKVTLGGDRRVGSGKKMRVELGGYGRSTHDLSRVRRTTMAAGTLVPIANILGLKGDDFEIDLSAEILTPPTVAPLFGSYKLQVDVFKADIRLYQGRLHNNETGLGQQMNQVYLPEFTLEAPYILPTVITPDKVSVAQINPSSILGHLGMAGIGQRNSLAPNGKRSFNGTSLLTYYDVVKNYYSNPQEKVTQFIHTPVIAILNNVNDIEIAGNNIVQAPTTGSYLATNGDSIVIGWSGANQPLSQIIFRMVDALGNTIERNGTEMGTVVSNDNSQAIITMGVYSGLSNTFNVINWRYATAADIDTEPIQIQTLPLDHLDELRRNILAWGFTNPATPYNIVTQAKDAHGLEPWVSIFENVGGKNAMLQSQEGLCLKTYQSGLLTNWLNSSDVNQINVKTFVNTSSGGGFTMDALNLAEKLYNIENRILAAGGDWYAWQEAVTGLQVHRKSEIPVYMGGLSKELVFEEVISTSETSGQGQQQPLGTLAGRGRMSSKHKGGRVHIRVEEPCVIMIIASLTPRENYSQGNDWTFNLRTVDDFHKPELDQIGFQDLIAERMAYWTTFQNPTGVWQQQAVGKQPAWINYQTAIDENKGNFAAGMSEDFMTLNRRYEARVSGNMWLLGDATAYIDPAKFNHTFAVTSLDSQNFWGHFGMKIEKRSVMSANVMPNM